MRFKADLFLRRNSQKLRICAILFQPKSVPDFASSSSWFSIKLINVVLSNELGAIHKKYVSMKLLSSGRCRGSVIHSPHIDVENVSREVLGAFRAATNPTTAEVDNFKYMANRLEPQAAEVFQQSIDALQVDTSFPADGEFLLVVKVFFNMICINSDVPCVSTSYNISR